MPKSQAKAIPLTGLPDWPQAPHPDDVYVQLRLGLEPVTASRARLSAAEYTVIDGERVKTRSARGYHEKALKQYQETVGWLLKQSRIERNDVDDLGVHAVFHVQGMQRRDIDNFVKALLDACNGIAWRDDHQVSQLTSKVVRGSGDPHVDLAVYVAEHRSRNCPKCGKALAARQITLGQIYCSKACYDQEQRKGAYRACAICGTVVYRKPGKAGAKQVFCSPACRAIGRGNCRECGAPNDKAWSGRLFCSTECSVSWHQKRAQGATSRPSGTCSDCGGPTYSAGSERCRACFIANKSLKGQSPKRKATYDTCPDCGGRKRTTSMRCSDCFQKARPRNVKEAA